jgi:hypothetical protein
MALRRWVLLCVGVCLLVIGIAGRAGAVYIDSERTFRVIAKVQTRVTFRLQDASGFTAPADVGIGDLVQWRNLALIELDHDLRDLTDQLDIFYPLKALDIRAKYHIVGRFMYDAVYDVGPQSFQDLKEYDKENITNFSQQYDLWECYLDLSRNDAFLRIGKQNLAWGETDVFRLLDGINPLDNTFGGPFEDLDDRRIPLWMLRGSYNFGNVGPIGSLTLEGFWVPGNWDARVAPIAPAGTPYAPPQPPSPLPKVLVPPSKVMSSSRWGVRLLGVLGGNYSFNIAHYKTYMDVLSLRLAVGDSPLDAWSELSYPAVQITGASMNFWESHTDVIVRSEVAWFWDEPVFIPEVNLPMAPLPFPVPGIPGLPQNGTVPKKDQLKWMIGLDKNVWLRSLNKTSTFMMSFQWFATWVSDFDERQCQPLALYPESTHFSAAKEFSSNFTFLTNTMYLKGALNPQMVLAYDIRGAWMFVPSIKYILEPFRFLVQYSGIVGNMSGFGAFRDRDQIAFIVTYQLN